MFIFWTILSLTIAAGALTGAYFAGRTLVDRSSGEERVRYKGTVGRSAAVLAGGAVLWVLVSLLFTVHKVSTGEVGVVYRFGKIVGQRDPGIQLLAPWETLTNVSTKVQKFRFQKDAGQGDEIVAFSKETQDVFFDVTLNYSVSKEAVQGLLGDVGTNWFEIIVPSRVQNFFKEATVHYAAVDVAPHREDIRTAVREQLRAELAPYSINVNDLLIDNLDFSEQYKKAIENKQEATQNAQAAQAKVAQAQAEAAQKVETAKGDAESVTIAASAQAQANAEIAASLTPELVQWSYVQKLGPGVRVIITDGKTPVIVSTTGSADAAAAVAGG